MAPEKNGLGYLVRLDDNELMDREMKGWSERMMIMRKL